jgi:hypothetical protein
MAPEQQHNPEEQSSCPIEVSPDWHVGVAVELAEASVIARNIGKTFG